MPTSGVQTTAIAPPGRVSGWPRGDDLTLESVTVRRGETVILDAINLRFEADRRYVLIGPSGAGKSTLLRLLNRLEDPVEGSIRLGSMAIRDLPIRSVREGVGLVFQSPRPLPGTVAENLAFPFLVRKWPLPSRERMAEALIEVGLDPRWLDREASGLSGGERQRLGIAVALGIGPEILALDEPTSALDPASARRVADLLAERCETEGLRTIVVSHHRGHAPLLGDTAIVMERGKVVDQGPIADVLAKNDAAKWAEESPRSGAES